MSGSLTRAVLISGLVLTTLGSALIAFDRHGRAEASMSDTIQLSSSGATMSTSQTSSTRSGNPTGINASASSRASAFAGRSGDCAAEATAVAESDGKRVSVHRSHHSRDGATSCSAEAHVDAQAGSHEENHD